MIEPGIYKDVMSSFPSGVTVVTTLDPDGAIVGITASAFSALSIDPALVLFCPNYASDTYPVLRDSKQFAIHLLSAEQTAEAYAFAGKGKDKAKGIEWHLSELATRCWPRPRRSSSANCGANTTAVITRSSSAR
jgi:flavin reductase (DIM6/NTAB) family NADH-FMN oxidoreductase RutF